MAITRTDLAELAVFAAVARHQSFSKAALELGVSASALSHSLKGLETRLGVRLLNRSTRAVVPTDAGQRLLTQLLPTLSHLESALGELARHSDEPVGRLKISAPRGAIDELLAPVLIDYMVRYPRMQVEVVEQELMPRLIEDGYDAALFYGDLLPKEMIGVPLGPPQRYLVVASPAYLAEHGTPQHPRELTRHACIGYRLTPSHHYRWAFAGEEGAMLEIEVTGPLTTSTPALYLGAAEAGLGLAYCLEEEVSRQLAEGTLVSVLEPWCPTFVGFSLFYPSRHQLGNGLRALIDMLKGHYQPR
ncbi:LysR family transcriptional regulator [Aeromonas hydrophila]|jgi:DNA-binding transcriptional LysR family regulator|uniref:Putative HTH-type transcriptional regulator YcaN n=1 Tax=Aeromonas hydrophila subsp. hydrophila (strain ATCC 7966 / DSM 30187 / BCRC 13018 / CCUG 14551 / JCM 1027 / KCTC 2358 / NCIMB 9240 / NCTC 8049) TaxID=380703 RepID=A0KHI5_AERHH|nr:MULTISPECIES: LysR substrate-binding domain-containing protein [Aeromonas]ABK36426.1 putative HTH-type transcriptional regulator YcaN [Aeromonas hydrophila subsp. hydrophila ATCC 7966]MBL0671443.1 LysR family transcriptional regulator [Aeromonas hydrophila]MBS4670407.1 LysR family transcriptional regulator [Aeromonas hydrophila]OOD32906.1 LysR family transcriptional regulator [Aeromonas hydrophila]QWL73098.1 LysR family transcriptional regulator [Aeromonas hydrophila]